MRASGIATVLVAAALAVAGCGSSSKSSSASTGPSGASTSTSTGSTTATGVTPASQGQLGPEGIPLETGPVLAPASTATQGKTVDGIQCAPQEQVAYHVHAHLQVYDDGKSLQIPAAIGLVSPFSQQTAAGTVYGAQKCYYFLHTHVDDGVIHIESPTQRIYTLGNFFDEWQQPLSNTEVAASKGKVTAFLNGKRWTKNVRDIPLESHFEIQLDIGSPIVQYKSVSFAKTSL